MPQKLKVVEAQARKEEAKLALFEKKQKAKRIGKAKSFPVQKITPPQRIISKEQALLNSMFNGNDLWGTGRNLPQMNRSLISGRGLIKSGDMQRETAGMFGIK